jgi:hypothetical protein
MACLHEAPPWEKLTVTELYIMYVLLNKFHTTNSLCLYIQYAAHVQWWKNSILTCLNLSPICNEVCRVHNVTHLELHTKQQPKSRIWHSQVSAFIKNYAIYVLWHNLGILICDFMQQKSSTDWQRLGMVVINCIKHSEVYLGAIGMLQ